MMGCRCYGDSVALQYYHTLNLHYCFVYIRQLKFTLCVGAETLKHGFSRGHEGNKENNTK